MNVAETTTTEGPGRGRIVTLDLLRGLALLGMLMAHCRKLLGGDLAGWGDNPAGWFITLLVAEKDRAVFAFLFGVGFAVMLRQLEKKGLGVGPIFLRRLGVLYAIGFAVEVLTPLPILRDYAWWGLALLVLKEGTTKSLLVIAVLSLAAWPLREAASTAVSTLKIGWEATVRSERAQIAGREAQLRDYDAQVTSGTYAEVVWTRAVAIVEHPLALARYTPDIYLTLFILGLLALRHGIFADPWRHRRLIIGFMVAGVVAWAAYWWWLPGVSAAGLPPKLALRLPTGFGFLDEQWLAFTAIGGVALLVARRPVWATWLAPLGWVGKMALTNYLVHAAVLDFLAAHYGLGWRIPGWAEIGLALGLFAAMALGSRWWLQRYQYGPVEWAWRCLTYWQRQPLRRAAGAVAAE
ncbi:MAG: hypothetical protein B9S34_14515 [Opitutia bacterium Tous-C1TDCM]|nr:MAG: hypothetical protein B9S34_14515 [Opitutae bacterium Tous-C1TDCM]